MEISFCCDLTASNYLTTRGMRNTVSIRWVSISTPENKKRIPGLLKILMNFSRACWSTRRQTLFGSRKDRNMLQRTWLYQHVNTWYDASRKEALINKSKFPVGEIVLSKNNDAIAKWLDRRYDDRAKFIETFKRNTGKQSIFSFLIPAETRRQNNSAFQTRLQEARRANLPTSSNTVDGDQSQEEPPD